MRRLMALLLAASCLSLTPAAAKSRAQKPAVSQPFAGDGAYVVEATTDEGPCPKLTRDIVEIRSGQVVSTGKYPAAASGIVDSDGTVSLGFRMGEDLAHVGGKFNGAKGAGTWSSNTAECGGHWKAEKQR